MHWTYEKFKPDSDLEQGDIIFPNDELRKLLLDVHPYFADEKYIGFAVASQSCDLVRRGGESKARYISIAPVRALPSVAHRLFEQVIPSVAPGLFRASLKRQGLEFLKRLFDQNEQALGLFYLHEDGEVGLGVPCVAFLRVKVALKAQHYAALTNARRGRLSPEFRAKFGWLVGNLYSRAASPDWSDYPGGEGQIEKMTSAYIEEQLEGLGPVWVDDELVDAGEKRKVKFAARDRGELLRELESLRPKPALDRLAEEVVKQGRKALTLRSHELTSIREAKSAAVSALAAQTPGSDDVASVVETLVESVLAVAIVSDERLTKMANRLTNSGVIAGLLK